MYELRSFLDRVKKSTQMSSFIKICPLGTVLFSADARTDGQRHITKLLVAFHNYANASTKDMANAAINVVLSSDDSQVANQFSKTLHESYDTH